MKDESTVDSRQSTVSVELNETCARLLAKLCVELNAEDDPAGIVSQALGLLELVQRTKKHGGRLCFENERGELTEVFI